MDNLDKSLCRIIIFAAFCLAFAFMLPVPTYGQADMLNPEGMTQVMPGVDDSTAHVQLGHGFPYMGGVFTDAWMSSNGFLLFYDPVSQFGNPNTWNQGCCSGYNPSGNGYFSYMLAPLWTDLRDPDGSGEAGYYYKTDNQHSSFLWYNVIEYGTSNTNTFQVDLYSGGSFDFIYDEVDITQHSVWIGFTGDTEKTDSSGNYVEVNELMYAQGGMTEFDIDFHSQTLYGGRAWYGDDEGYGEIDAGPDCSNPLNDTSCEGYEEAYYDQQCSADALYDSGCPGYAEAYYDQQCSADALYDSGCPGYAQAYLDQQCSLDSLYDSSCPGYAEAYLDQQCQLDPLSSPSCPNYATESALLAIEETILNNVGNDSYNTQSTLYDTSFDESFEEEFTPMEEDMSTFEENMYMSDEYVDEIYTTAEAMDPIEEEIAILEDLEVIDVMEEEILAEEEIAMLEELEESPINEEISEPTATRSNNSLAISLSITMANDLVSNLEEKAQNEAQNSSDSDQNMLGTQENGENSTSIAENGENSSVISGSIEENSANSIAGDIFSSDTELFFSMTGESQSESSESDSQDSLDASTEQNVQENLALGDAAPIGFAIIPMEMPSMQEEAVEEKSLAERMAEAIAEKNKEESNKAAIGQTAMLATLASGTDIGQYYDTAYTNNKQFYNEEKIYEGVVLRDNFRTHYNMFSTSQGSMYQLIRSQYDD